MPRTTLTLLFIIFYCCTAFAQGENKVWTFGLNAGLNFNSGAPVFFQSSNLSVEGCASIADAAGNLLFYSNGSQVWNASGAVMPNGNGIQGNGAYAGATPGSCAQGVAIVKSLVNAQQYYLFTLDAFEQISLSYPGYLRYSIIDMSLNGGTGDVLPSMKNIVLDSFMSEKMTITTGDCNYWLLTHRWNSKAYKAFRIDATGIHAPVSSNGIWGGSLSGGQIKVSFDGNMVANSHEYGVELASFNKVTGMVSNAGQVDSTPTNNGHFGAAFSPDNQRLYIGTSTELHQYNLSAFPNVASVQASKTVLATVPAMSGFGQFRNAPDGKIYIAFFFNYPYLAIINNANNAGTASNFVLNGLALPAYALGPPGFNLGLGNDVITLEVSPTDTVVHATTDTLLCTADSFRATAPDGYETYTWNDGATGPSRVFTQSGVYWVYSHENCGTTIDTFKINFLHLQLSLGADTSLCPGDSLRLQAGQNGAGYRWQDNSSNPDYTAHGAGSYWVELTTSGCTISDTITIGLLQPAINIVEGDTTICANTPFTLHTTSQDIDRYLWNNGGLQSQLVIREPGTYTVTGISVCGNYLDSVHIQTRDCECLPFLPNAFSPNGDGKNEQFAVRLSCVPVSYSLNIYNRYGQRIFNTNEPTAAWDGRFKGQVCELGTYYYYLEYKNESGLVVKRKGDLSLVR